VWSDSEPDAVVEICVTTTVKMIAIDYFLEAVVVAAVIVIA